MGNPPFNGARWQSAEQKNDTESVWRGARGVGDLDFVANWYIVTSRYIASTGARAAFVSTSSITQGIQPAIIWRELTPLGIHIDFAHRTFKWSNEASGSAAVHTVIIGFSANPKPPTLRLWDYAKPTSVPVLQAAKNINAYLLDAADVLVEPCTRPLTWLPRMEFGSMPNDGGHISSLTDENANEIRRDDPIAAKFLRRIVGGQELLHGDLRWCLWLVDATPDEIQSSRILSERVRLIRETRLASKREATRKLAQTSWLFGENRQPSSEFLAVPLISSENREYLAIEILRQM